MNAEPLEDHYSVRTICERLDLSESKVRRAIGKQPGEPGYLRSVLVGRDSRRVPASAIAEWLRSDGSGDTLATVHELRRTT